MSRDLPLAARVRTSRRIDEIFAARCSAGDHRIVLYAASQPAPGRPRIGLVVGRRLGSAVRRNRFKRLLRAAFREVQDRLPAELDYLVVPRPNPRPTLDGFIRSLLDLAPRLALRARRIPPPAEPPR